MPTKKRARERTARRAEERKLAKQKLKLSSKRMPKKAMLAILMFAVVCVLSTVYILFPEYILTQTRDKEITEEELWDIIYEVEESFLEFGKELEPKIAKLDDPYLQEQLANPFKLVRMNKDNIYRNCLYVRSVADELANEKGFMRQENINFFSYGTWQIIEKQHYYKEQIEHLYACYIPLARTVIINSDNGNLLDQIVLHHELYHSSQDIKIRAELDTREKFDEYTSFFTGSAKDKPSIIINWEFTAYGMELELINLILDGYMYNQSIRHAMPEVEYVADGLEARKDQIPTIELLCEMSIKYFPEGITLGGYTNKFVRHIANLYHSSGSELYLTDETGFDSRCKIVPDDL